MANQEKRNRTSNFSVQDELHLAEEILVFKNIVECKTSNAVSVKQKV